MGVKLLFGMAHIREPALSHSCSASDPASATMYPRREQARAQVLRFQPCTRETGMDFWTHGFGLDQALVVQTSGKWHLHFCLCIFLSTFRIKWKKIKPLLTLFLFFYFINFWLLSMVITLFYAFFFFGCSFSSFLRGIINSINLNCLVL